MMVIDPVDLTLNPNPIPNPNPSPNPNPNPNPNRNPKQVIDPADGQKLFSIVSVKRKLGMPSRPL